LFFDLGRGLAWLAQRSGGLIVETLREAGGLGAFEPFANGFFGNAESGRGGAQRGAVGEMMLD